MTLHAWHHGYPCLWLFETLETFSSEYKSPPQQHAHILSNWSLYWAVSSTAAPLCGIIDIFGWFCVLDWATHTTPRWLHTPDKPAPHYDSPVIFTNANPHTGSINHTMPRRDRFKSQPQREEKSLMILHFLFMTDGSGHMADSSGIKRKFFFRKKGGVGCAHTYSQSTCSSAQP